jgi:hypothetical protein
MAEDRDYTRMEPTGYGYYVNNHDNSGGRSFKRCKDGLRAAQDYYAQQRRYHEYPDTCAGCGEPHSTRGGQFCYECRHPEERG